MSLEKVFHGKNGNFYVFLHSMISFSYYLGYITENAPVITLKTRTIEAGTHRMVHLYM